MKALTLSVLLSAIAFGFGCATQRPPLVLDPIGPPDSSYVSLDRQGILVVFSALGQAPVFETGPYHRYYSDYKLCSDSGELIRIVHNDNGGLIEGPSEVRLSPGKYRVIARANGYGAVTVPVVIAANQITTVHLEGGSSSSSKLSMLQDHAVRLPNGDFAGWRGTQNDTASH